MNKKGNVWIVGLFILQIILVISTNFCINLDHLLKINQIDPTFECVKIKVMNRIKEEFRDNEMEDFEMDIDGYHVEVIYNVFDCNVVFDGEHYVEMFVEYDLAFMCIGSIEYDFEGWE